MKQISPAQIEVLKELLNIGVGRAAGSLNELLHAHVELHAPVISVLTLSELEELEPYGGRPLAAVQLVFSGPIEGAAALVFPPESANRLIDVVTGKQPQPENMDGLRIGALTEVGNIVLNGVMGSISNVLEQHLDYEVPEYFEEPILVLVQRFQPGDDCAVIMARIEFSLRELTVEGEILVFLGLRSFTALLGGLDRWLEEADES